jgi:hypothetical protein
MYLKENTTLYHYKYQLVNVVFGNNNNNNNKENSGVASFVSRHITIRPCCDISQACSDDIR